MVPIGFGGSAPVSRVSLLFVCLGFCLPHRFRSFFSLSLHVWRRLSCWVLEFCVLSRLESREEEEEERRRRRIRKGQQSWNLRISKLFQKRTSTACPPWSTNFKSVTGLSLSYAGSFDPVGFSFFSFLGLWSMFSSSRPYSWRGLKTQSELRVQLELHLAFKFRVEFGLITSFTNVLSLFCPMRVSTQLQRVITGSIRSPNCAHSTSSLG